ncbi:MAG: hypothetical protein L6V83_06110 [Christensenella sp.]|nr:MAG: hypothetical protein L6V83_06110 [Christensenella sp.]
MKKKISFSKIERLAKTGGIQGWTAMFALLAIMCLDQFVLEIPFENVVFPILVVCAACMSPAKNAVLVITYSVIFEMSCIGWFPSELPRVQLWLFEVIIGYFMPLACYKAFNRKHEDMSVISYAALAAMGEILYFWVSVVATALIWGWNFGAYFASDIPFEIAGAFATFACALPVAFIYKLTTKEITLSRVGKTLRPLLDRKAMAI